MHSLAYLPHALVSAGAALLITSIAAYIGFSLLSHWPLVPAPTLTERWVFGTGLGFGVLSLGMYILGCSALWTPAGVWGLLAILTLFSTFILRKPVSATESDVSSQELWRAISTALLGFLFFAFFLFNLVPETFYDALFYHLSVPDLYRQAHRIMDIPTLLFSNLVQTLQLLYGMGLTLGSSVTAKWLHVLFGVMMLGGFLSLGKRYFNDRMGALPAFVFFSLPAAGLSILTATADLGWSAFQFLGGYALVIALVEHNSGWLLLAGTLSGIGASCKSMGLAFVPVLTLLVLWQKGFDEGRPWSETFSDATRFLLPACLALSPLWIRNMIMHGNPLFPFGASFFGGTLIEPERWRLFLSDAGNPNLVDSLGSVANALKYIFHPWLRTLRDQHAFYLDPLLLVSIPFVYTLPAPSTPIRILRRTFVAAWFIWMISNPTPRYALVTAAFLSPLAVFATVTHPLLKSIRGVLVYVWIGAAVINSALLVHLSVAAEGWKILTGQVTESDYLSSPHPIYPNPPYRAIAWMNDALPQDAKVLFVGEARTLGIERSVVPVGVIDPQPLYEWSRLEPDAQGIRTRFRKAGITHLFINLQEAKRTDHYRTMRWDRETWPRFQTFWKDSIRLLWKYEDANEINPQALYVYEILSEGEERKRGEAPPNPFNLWAKT